MLLAQARYRTNRNQTDSLVNSAYDYFKKTDLTERKALALYLKGGIAGENGDEQSEQRWYLKAKEEAEKTDNDRLGYLIAVNLCRLYAFRGLKDLALEVIREATRHAERLGEPKYLISANLYWGRVHSMDSADNERSVYHYRRAIDIAKESQNWGQLEMATWELVGVYSSMQDYDHALQLAREGMNLYEGKKEIPARTFVVTGEIYMGLGQLDSAYYYVNKGLHSKTPLIVKRGAYYLLYQLKWKQGLYKEAAEACHRSLVYNDSVTRSEKAREMIEMQAKYDQQQVILERNELQIEKDRAVRNFLLALVAAILIIALVVGVYQRLLIRKERALKQKEEMVRDNAQKIAENEVAMLRNRQRMEELMQQIEAEGAQKEQWKDQAEAFEEIRKQNDRLARENQRLEDEQRRYLQALKRQNHDVEELNRLAAQNKYLHEREMLLTEQLVRKSSSLNKVKTRHPYVRDEEWSALKEELDLIFGGYTQRLLKRVPSLSEGDMHLACLIKLQMTNKDMAEALGISPASVGKAKMRLKDRVAHEVPSYDRNQLVDLWLWDF